MSNEILLNQETVNTHRAAISRHSSSFDIVFSIVEGGTAPAISAADRLGSNVGGAAGRYASAVPRSANDIQKIANILAEVDTSTSAGFQAVKQYEKTNE